jgi:hypothetical protein
MKLGRKVFLGWRVRGLGLGVLLALGGLAYFYWNWTRLTVLGPRGGLYFPIPVELGVPSFRQNDPRWGKDRLGDSDGTLGSEGCAVASVAMVLGYYGVDTNPQKLNRYLSQHGGYTRQGWIYWERATELQPGRVRHVYENLPCYRLIDCNLLKGNPVIVRLRLRGGTHFVVIAGKRGLDYLTQDPGAGASKGLYPLKELGSRIEALRVYEKQR